MGRAYSMHGEKKNACMVLVGMPEGNKTTRKTGVGGRIIFRWILEK
jgi:hypothetical protein